MNKFIEKFYRPTKEELENDYTEEEFLWDCIYGDIPEELEWVETQEYEDVNEWQRSCTTIFKDKETNEYWAINWFKGLGEYQPNEIIDLPYRVKPVEKIIINYEKIED